VDSTDRQTLPEPNHPFVYSADWTGTKLSLLSLEQAVQPEHQQKSNDPSSSSPTTTTTTTTIWQMGRWPDPLLRRPATEVDPEWFGTSTLSTACQLLQRTAQAEGAVGLAAQQCGLDARILYLEQPRQSVLVNPHIIRRSPETQGRVWNERCLVLPPTFIATVVRDDWVDVQYHTWEGRPRQIRLQGEASRCIQHELDHDRGILVTDHVGLDELESDVMRALERPGHEERMLLAYSRQVDDMESLQQVYS
jgi:peptide deformylase